MSASLDSASLDSSVFLLLPLQHFDRLDAHGARCRLALLPSELAAELRCFLWRHEDQLEGGRRFG